MPVATTGEYERAKQVEVGDNILWWSDGHTSGEPYPGIVSAAAGNGVITAHIFSKSGAMPKMVSAVHHFSEPNLRDVFTKQGCWDYTPAMKILKAGLKAQRDAQEAKRQQN